MCLRCLRPTVMCWCDTLVQVPTATRVVILMHPHERRKAIGTGRMAALCIPDAQIHVGQKVAECPGLDRVLADPERPAYLLFPGPAAVDVDTAPPAGPITLVVIDGTWAQATRMVGHDPMLQALPRVSLRPRAPSQYRIRRQPRRECLSTIEALSHVLGVLERDPAGMERLLEPFRTMILRHLELREGRRVPRFQQRRAAKRAAAAGEAGEGQASATTSQASSRVDTSALAESRDTSP